MNLWMKTSFFLITFEDMLIPLNEFTEDSLKENHDV